MATLNELLYRTVDASFAIDSRQNIIYWDRGCEELLGYSEQSVFGNACYDVLNWCDSTTKKPFCHQDCHVSKMCEGSKGINAFQISAKDKDSKTFALNVSIMLLPDLQKHKWVVTHLLHRANFPDLLPTMGKMINTRKVANKSIRHFAQSDLISGATELDKSISRLTPREKEVLSLLAEGVTNVAISRKLDISNTTVRNHIQHIQGKLGVHSKTEAVAYAYRHHFL